jgi:hypothetical protein
MRGWWRKAASLKLSIGVTGASWVHLRFIDGWPVKAKRGLRLMRLHGLWVKPSTRRRTTRRVPTSKPRPTAPNQGWGIDMTKSMVAGFGGM